MTIFRKDKNLDLPIATFPIAIGLKTDNHNPVEEIVGRDIKDMMKSKLQAFIRSDNGIPGEITFSAAMFVSLGDQPERRSGNKLMAGNSRAHTRWRIAGDHVKLSCNMSYQLVKNACEQWNTLMSEEAMTGCKLAGNATVVPIGCLQEQTVHYWYILLGQRSQRDIS
jgi:hypothetical protein